MGSKHTFLHTTTPTHTLPQPNPHGAVALEAAAEGNLQNPLTLLDGPGARLALNEPQLIPNGGAARVAWERSEQIDKEKKSKGDKHVGWTKGHQAMAEVGVNSNATAHGTL